MDRFIRDYELIIEIDNKVVTIKPEIRVAFQIEKSIYGGLNSCKIQIYNLITEKREKLVKSKEENKRIPFLFKAGYSNLETIFKGTVFEASSIKSGADFITTISSQDGGYDFSNSYVSKTVTSGTLGEILESAKNTKIGTIPKRNFSRPTVLVGNVFKVLENYLLDDETYFIENETVNIIKENENIGGTIPLINAETGLLNIPTKINKEVNFTTLMNPAIKLGAQIQLESLFNKKINGLYKVHSIKYSGDNYGTMWQQECICQSKG